MVVVLLIFFVLQVVEASVGRGALPSFVTEALDELYAGDVFGVGRTEPVAIVPGATPVSVGLQEQFWKEFGAWWQSERAFVGSGSRMASGPALVGSPAWEEVEMDSAGPVSGGGLLAALLVVGSLRVEFLRGQVPLDAFVKSLCCRRLLPPWTRLVLVMPWPSAQHWCS
jgi:hypothetical protein